MEISYIAHKNDYKIRLSDAELKTLVQSVEDSQQWLCQQITAEEKLPKPFRAALRRWRDERAQLMAAMRPFAEGLGISADVNGEEAL